MPAQLNALRELIDGHAHLNEVYDIEGALERAVVAGVARIVAVGMDIASNRRVLEIAASSPGLVLPSVGFHPWRPARPWEKSDSTTRLLNFMKLYSTHLQTHPLMASPSLSFRELGFLSTQLRNWQKTYHLRFRLFAVDLVESRFPITLATRTMLLP